MRSLAIAVLFVAAGGSPGQAQKWAESMFDHTSYDFGIVVRGQTVEHRFPLENIYVEDVQITSIHSTCNCTKPKITHEHLKTYEKGEVVAVLDTHKFLGRRQATLKVKFSKPHPAEVRLQCYAYIRSDVVLEPGHLQLDPVPQGTRIAPKRVAISYAGREDWKIVTTESKNPHLDLELTERGRHPMLEKGRRVWRVTYDLLVGLGPDAPVGPFRDHVILVTNDTKTDAQRVAVPIEGSITAPISISPSPIMLGILRPKQKVSRNLVVRGKTAFRLIELSSSAGQFAFPTSDEPKSLHVVPFTFTAGNTLGKFSGTIHVRTDLPGNEPFEVRFDCQVVRP